MLELKNLCKTFNVATPYEKKLYNEFNLSIKEGDFISVIGSNGAGKSTLFKLISNNLELDSGSICFGKDDTSKNLEFETSKKISSVVQDPKMGTVGGMSVFENLSMSEIKGKKSSLKLCLKQNNLDKYRKILSEFNLGLEDKMNIKTNLLSGGQRQVLSLIMATINIPKLLLLDEHTAALDPKTSEKVMQITEKVVLENKLTCLMITHKLEDAIKYGNRLIMIHEGRVLIDIDGKEKEDLNIDSLLEMYSDKKLLLSDRQLFC